MKLFVILLLSVVSLSAYKSAHPFYMSSTELQLHSKTKKMELSCKIFADDLQQALAKELHQKVDLFSKDLGNKEWVCNYVNKHVQIFIDNKLVPMKCLGFEIEEEAVWCYMEASLKSMPQELVISNTILCEEQESQTNLVHVVYDGLRSSTKLSCSEATFVYKK